MKEQDNLGGGLDEWKRKGRNSVDQVRLCYPEPADAINTMPSL